MKKNKLLGYGVLLCAGVACAMMMVSFSFAQVKADQPVQVIVQGTAAQAPIQEAEQEKGAIKDSLAAAENVSLDFKDADINNVLKIISYKANMNIVATPDVIGNVTIKLVDVPWEQALDVILKTYGFGYQKQGNVILVTKIENMAKIQAEEALKTEIVILKFLDAQDAMKIIIPMLSTRGKLAMLYARGQKGWQFGTFRIGTETTTVAMSEQQRENMKQETVMLEKTPAGGLVSTKAEFEPSIKSKILLITDTAASIDRIRNVILPQIDKKPKQVLIETKIIEVSRDRLKDFGVEFNTGNSPASVVDSLVRLSGDKGGPIDLAGGGWSYSSLVKPSIFNPLTAAITGTEPFNSGAEILFRKMTGTQFDVLVHALEEDSHSNTLSAPRILTLDNQEAAIMVGFHTPILKSTVTAGSTAGTGATITQDLNYYQEIGIRLNVVPQVNEDNYINMIIHPSVTSTSSNITATSVASGITTETNFPVIDVREAQTQVLLKDGETIVIGGLLKDVQSKAFIGIPFLSKLPLLGVLFRRETMDKGKVDLLIFITARVVKDDEFTPEEIAKLQRNLGKSAVEIEAEKQQAVTEKKSKKDRRRKKK